MVAVITFNDKETEWSTNTKRGFISLFELNLNKRNLIEDVLQQPSGEASVNSYKVLEVNVYIFIGFSFLMCMFMLFCFYS